MEDWPTLTIGEVARRAGIATSAIRFYESVGLLPEPLRIRRQRRYGEDVLGRLTIIAAAQSAGFTLREVRELMARANEEGDLSGPMQALSQRKLPEVQAAIERAEQMKAWLESARECGCSRRRNAGCSRRPAIPMSRCKSRRSANPAGGLDLKRTSGPTLLQSADDWR